MVRIALCIMLLNTLPKWWFWTHCTRVVWLVNLSWWRSINWMNDTVKNLFVHNVSLSRLESVKTMGGFSSHWGSIWLLIIFINKKGLSSCIPFMWLCWIVSYFGFLWMDPSAFFCVKRMFNILKSYKVKFLGKLAFNMKSKLKILSLNPLFCVLGLFMYFPCWWVLVKFTYSWTY